MRVDKEEVGHIAKLARLSVSEEEAGMYSAQLSAILEYMEKLNEMDTSGVEPTSHVLEIKNVMRDDRVRPSLPADEVLKNCPDRKDDFYRVPKIIE
jgi:aspartyl-tRNA(Asn)/glutamyl-tRNA(Gln) amidotransferase subunit C